MMTKKIIQGALGICALFLTPASSVAAAQQPDSRPNIVFIYADDLGWGDLAVNGNKHILTPNLDKLAAEGMNFHQFTVANPVCSPSRVALMTGNFPSRFGVHQHFMNPAGNRERGMPDWLDPEAVTLAKILKQSGYATAHYGKWHLCLEEAKGAPEPPAYGYDDAAVYCWPGPHTRDVFEGTSVESKRGVPYKGEAPAYLTIAAVDNALKFIDAHKAQPFFINLWIHETHAMVVARPEDRIPYRDVPEPEQTYYAAVTRADGQVGRILEKLKELNLADNTIIVFSSDNGPEVPRDEPKKPYLYFSRGSAGGLRGMKRSLYSGGVGTPFIIRWPGKIPAGKVDKTTMLSNVDMLPTLAAAAGVQSLPGGYQSDGENMLQAFFGHAMKRSKPLFWKWNGDHSADFWPAYAMREGRWVFLISEDRTQAELYDIFADRSQTHDLAGKEPERVRMMRQQTEQWIESLPKTLPARITADGIERSAAAQKHPSRPGARPVANRPELFKRIDRNHDGLLSFDEFLHSSGLQETEARKRFDGFDANRDGILSEGEFDRAGK